MIDKVSYIIKENLKILISQNFMLRIHRLLRKNKNRRKVYILGTPLHGNLGDHAIAVAEIQFVQKNLPESLIISIPMSLCNVRLKSVVSCISEEDLIIISGGGWLGDLWKHNELLVRKLIELFPNNKIMIFPQTVYYHEQDNLFAKEARRIYSQHKKLYFCVRERQSFDYVMSNGLYYKKENILYVPDIVLSLKYLQNYERTNIAFCFRQDIERSVDTVLIEKIKEYLKKNNVNLQSITTLEKGIIPSYKSKEKLEKKLAEFSRYRLVITDRLHAMLFATITSTPCIAFDNKTHKVKGVYDWIIDQGYIQVAENYTQFVEIFEELKDIKNVEYSQKMISEALLPLIRILKGDEKYEKNK